MRPYYIFDKNKLTYNLDTYKKHFKVFYPCKVNSCDGVIHTIKNAGCGFEVDSILMIERLINYYSVNPDKILYNGLIRSREDVEKAIELGISFFAIDTMDALKQIEENKHTGLSFLIRVSINSLTKKILNPLEKWGASVSDALKMADYICDSDGLRLSGFSFYYPKEFKKISYIQESIQKIADFSGKYDNITIDIGGGIDMCEIDEIVSALPKGFEYIIEPGRHLVGDCFNLVCNVVDYKNIDGKLMVFLDVGIYSGFIDVVIKKHSFEIESLLDDKSEKTTCYLCGCTSDISDYLGEYLLPIDTINKKGALIIRNCGAYCPQMHMDFSEHLKCEIKEL